MKSITTDHHLIIIDDRENKVIQTTTSIGGDYEFRRYRNLTTNLTLPFDNDDGLMDGNKILPDLFIWCFIGLIVVGGLLLNGIILIGILRTKCNGILYIILQLTLCDIGMLLLSPIELFYTTNQSWIFVPELCSFYMGFEAFTTTAMFYFIISANFHSISTHNLAIKQLHQMEESSKELNELVPDEDEDDDDNDNYEIAIKYHPTDQKRSLTIDYRKRKSSISVILPVLFVWFLSASISFPLFIFANLFTKNKSQNICGILEFNRENNILLSYLILLIKILVPSFILLVTFIKVLMKYINGEFYDFNKLELDENVMKISKLSAVLTVTFFFFNLPKFYASLMFEIVARPFTTFHLDSVKLMPEIALTLLIVFYLMSLIRPVLYLYYNKNLRIKCCRSVKK